MAELFVCPWGCGQTIEVGDPSSTEIVTCPRCVRDCLVKQHDEADDTSWFELTPDR